MTNMTLINVAFITVIMSCTVPAAAGVSLSPENWSAGELQRLEQYNLLKYKRPKPLAFSEGKGLVAGTSQAFAVHAGVDALRKGGNAMDACLATALAEVVLSAGSYVSFAGVANILYYDKASDKVYNVEGGWNTVTHQDPGKIPDAQTKGPNGATILVPGFIAGVVDAAEKFAKFPLSTLLEPALYFAEKGFKMPFGMAIEIAQYYNDVTLLRTPQGKEIFTNDETGKPYAYNELFKQPHMVEFIQNVSEFGKKYVYQDYWARELVVTVRSEGGNMEMEDLENYQTVWHEPAKTTYSGYDAFTTGADWGSAELVEKVNLMELAGIDKSSDSYLTNATKLFWLASIARFSSFVSNFAHYYPNGLNVLEREFGLDLSTHNRLTKETAEQVWEKIGSVEKMKEINDIIKRLSGGERAAKTSEHSDGVVAIDSEGNVCAMAHTINSRPWGTGLFVQGIALSNFGAIFKYYVMRTKPGARLATGLQPAIFQGTSDSMSNEEETTDFEKTPQASRRPVMALSVIGSSYPVVVPQLITNVLDSHMNPRQAMDAPYFLAATFSTNYQSVPVEEFAISKNVLDDVMKLGQIVTEVPWLTYEGTAGKGVVLTADAAGRMYGGAYPGLNGFSEGV